MSEKVKKILISLLLDNSEPNRKISEINDFSNIIALKVADDMLQNFC